MDHDEQHLQTLSILHYVYAGLTAVISLAGLFYVAIGAVTLDAPQGNTAPPSPPPELGWFFICVGGCITLFGWSHAVLDALAGRFLARQKYWIFCLVVACIDCMNLPLGTLLGIFTIIVLVRPTVKERFEALSARPVEWPPDLPSHRPDDPSFRPG